MKIKIICVGKIKEKFYTEAINEYSKRLSKFCILEIHEVADEMTPDGASQAVVDKILNKEGERIMSHVKDSDYVITLEIEGKRLTSEKLAEKIEEHFFKQSFPYTHIIIDEGQDFGSEKIEESDILQLIYDIVCDDPDDRKTFYVFYDKLQLIQADRIPKFISEADCKLTLYKNCRNTKNIAETSLKPISERTPKMLADAVKGLPVKMHYTSDTAKAIENVEKLIAEYEEKGIKDVVILTAKTETSSILSNVAKDGKFKKKLFTTCRKYKGLETDAVILIDVDAATFMSEQRMLYYVGASRARQYLSIVTEMNDEDCQNILNDVFSYEKVAKIPKKELSMKLNVMPVVGG